ncbi:CRISPR-associated helicase Cas3' [Tissierella creatinini]|nr:CRISPR-associated helicase Cas3' [Tissierella creatinini]TJX64600.1 CRISPR-associated helicase Cas3' [Soehngenia saccharolytica]
MTTIILCEQDEIMKNITIKDIINNLDSYRAHSRDTDGHEEYEGLYEHLELTHKYYSKIYKEKELEQVFDRIYNNLFTSEDFKPLYYSMISATIYCHDLGKINPRFQKEKMNNENIKLDLSFQDSHHSSYGSWIYMRLFLKEMFNIVDSLDAGDDDICAICNIITININAIGGHHGSLKARDEIITNTCNNDTVFSNINFFRENFNLEWTEYKDDLESLKFFANIDLNDRKKQASLYIYSRLIFGLLTQADILATMEFTEKIETSSLGLIDKPDEILENYDNNNVTKIIREYELGAYSYDNGNINEVRTRMFLEAEKNLNHDKNIFTLEAPTGAGKTNISVNLALKLLANDRRLNKIFYAFPYNTLVEQTYTTLLETFKENKKVIEQISIYNSVNSFEDLDKIYESSEEDKEEISFKTLYRDYQFLYYPITVSTNIKLFEIFFGNSKSSYYPLPLMANSIIILDEIQSYKNLIWHEMIEMVGYFAEILNIKFIIMSATLPGIQSLIDKSQVDGLVETLIKNPSQYYLDTRFKDRVECDFSILEIKEENYDDKKMIIFQHIVEIIKNSLNGKKLVLLEFIRKKTALDFYSELNNTFENSGIVIKHIDGDTSKRERKDIIDLIKARKNPEKAVKLNENLRSELDGDFILVSTQVVEAGVDIDMDIGFKDISLLDSEEQFLGRINRNLKSKDAKAYFFDLDEVKRIYEGDVRTEKSLSLKNKDIQDLLVRKNFKDYYELVLRELNTRNLNTSDEYGYKGYVSILKGLDFEGMKKHFKLIDENDKYTIYLNVSGEICNTEDLWMQYKNLLMANMDYAEKKIRLMNLRAKMDSFTYEIYSIPSNYQDYFGGIYYFKNGDDYMINGKFHSELMKNDKNYSFM